MKVFQRVSSVLCSMFLAMSMIVLNHSAVFAEDKQPEYRLQVSPAKQDIGDLKPGESYAGAFKVQNTGKNSFDFKVSASPYSVKDELYSPEYDKNSQYTDIVNWIKFSATTGHVDPNQEQEIAYTIKVPSDVPAGGQYLAITVELTNTGTTEGSGVAITQQVGSIVYANVHGNTRKTGEVIENKIPTILFNPPVSTTSIVNNTGNTHATASYILEVCPLFSGKASDGTLCDEEVYTNRENPDTLTILPETRRFNTITWPGSPKLGIFRVRQTVSMFDQTSTVEKVVFLCPIWFAFIIILLIFCAVFWIITRVRARSRDNRSE